MALQEKDVNNGTPAVTAAALAAEEQQRAVFSRIPSRTWRWLGANTAYMPEGLTGEPVTQTITVEPGQRDAVVLSERESGAYTVQADVQEGAVLDLVKVQLVPDDAPYTSRIHIHLGRGAKLNYTAIEAGAVHTASELEVDMEGDDSQSDIWSLYFGDGESEIDLNYIIRQRGQRTDANMQVRGALLGHAEKTFRGTLDFQRGSAGSVGRENEEVVLLSPGVRNRSVPIMLSHEDDVDGHHAVSIGKMDENKLYYLMSRGLDLAAAQRLVVEASFQPVLDRIPQSEQILREEIDAYLLGRLSENE